MNLKRKLFGLLKYAGATTACLAVVPSANAQSQYQSQPTRTRQVQQQRMEAVEEAPRLLSAADETVRPPYPTETEQRTRRPTVSPRAQRSGFVPAHQRNSPQVRLANYPSKTSQVFGESIIEDGGSGGCGPGGCGNGGCSSCGIGGEVIDGGYGFDSGIDTGCGVNACGISSTNPCGYPTYPALISFSDMEFFAGAQAFKGSLNLGQSGSFGFNEGLNWGFPLPIFQGLGLSGQLGARFTQSNGKGGGFTPNTREQIFVTGGIFRRVDYGLQLGVTYDYMNENWYFKGTYGQVRGEASWVGSYGNTIGFRYTVETEEEPGIGPTALALDNTGTVGAFNTFVPLDTYRFFYEQKVAQTGALVNGWGGFTGNSQALLGADIKVPLTERLLVHSSGTILIDDSSTTNTANIDEAWNLSVNLVFIPKGWSNWKRAYHRPMFDVADNGSFLIGRN